MSQKTRSQSMVVLLIVTLLLSLLLQPQPLSHAAGASAYIRVNQVGYITGETKQAILMTSSAQSRISFSVVNLANGQSVYTAPIGASQGSWSSSFPHTYLLDFSAVKTPGNYDITISGSLPATSPAFQIGTGAALYSGLLPNALFFYQAQRDGPKVNPQVMKRQPSHLKDEQAYIYSTPTYKNDVLQGTLHRVGGQIDASGGWFDAGDNIKFVETASYTDAIMLFAVRQYPRLFIGGPADFNSEGKYGLDWLQKMWDNTNKTLYYQVGIGDGNGSSIYADHDYWRLPQQDDQLNAKPGDKNYYVEYRPVFRLGAAGTQISPNLAGRMAADLALCYQLYHKSNPSYANQCLSSAETIFDLAKTNHVGQLTTAAPYDYYPEVEWRDDMELAATELYVATSMGDLPLKLKHTNPLYYLKLAAHWAHAYMTGPNDGTDSLNLYDVSGLAHYELYKAIAQAGYPNLEVSQADLLKDLHNQLTNGTTQARQDPFGLGIAYGGGDASPHALGYYLEGSFYAELTGSNTFNNFALTQRNWILGDNAWGSSFIVGAGSTFPHCMQHMVANLVGSVDGKPPIVLGATVDGPSATGNFQGLGLPNTPDPPMQCPATKGYDPFKLFTGKGARYFDNTVAWPSVEPADDYTALSILVFARQIA